MAKPSCGRPWNASRKWMIWLPFSALTPRALLRRTSATTLGAAASPGLAGCAAGTGRDAGRNSVASYERIRRGARPSDGGGRDARAPSGHRGRRRARDAALAPVRAARGDLLMLQSRWREARALYEQIVPADVRATSSAFRRLRTWFSPIARMTTKQPPSTEVSK